MPLDFLYQSCYNVNMESHTQLQFKEKTCYDTEEEIQRVFDKAGIIARSSDIPNRGNNLNEFGVYDYSKKGHLDNITNLAPKATLFYGRP